MRLAKVKKIISQQTLQKMISNLIVLITGLIGLLTVGVLLKNYKSNNLMNVWSISILLIICFRFLLLSLSALVFQGSWQIVCKSYSNFAVVTFPMFYLYFKNLTTNDRVVHKADLLHFIIPIGFFVVSIINDFFEHILKNFNFLIFAIFFLYTIFYSYRSYKVLKKNIWSKKKTIKVFQQQEIKMIKWTYFLFLVLIFMVFRLLGSIFLKLVSSSSIGSVSFDWIGALLWLIILIKMIFSPEILFGIATLNKKIDETRNENLVLNTIWNIKSKMQINNLQHLKLKKIIDPNILHYIEKIEKISMEDKFFRNYSVVLTDLANTSNIPKSHLYYIFKYHSTISFSDYKKAIRIQDAITLINEGYLVNNTMDFLSEIVGFSSYNTFFTSFKDIVGVSPVEYFKALKKIV